MPAERAVQWLWWKDSFAYQEVDLYGPKEITDALQQYVQSVRPYPKWAITMDRLIRGGQVVVRRAFQQLRQPER
jgi:hypothetical protein